MQPRIAVVGNDQDATLDLLEDRLPGAVSYRAAAGLPTFGDFDGLVVLGGDMSVRDVDAAPWLPELGRLMLRCGSAGVPVLAICLGAQLLAVAGHGTVQVGAWAGPERGVVSIRLRPEAGADPVLGPVQSVLGTDFAAPTMHSDAISELPPDAEWLASSAQYPFQAFRIGSALGVQFHPETSAPTLKKWAAGDPDDAAIDALYERHGDDLTSLIDAVATGFLREVRVAAHRRQAGGGAE